MNIFGTRLPTDDLRRPRFVPGQMAGVFELRPQELFDSPFPRQGVVRHIKSDSQFHVVRKIHQLSHPFKQRSANAGPCRKFNFAVSGTALSVDRPITSDGPCLGFAAPGHATSICSATRLFATCSVHTDCTFPLFSSQFRRKTPSTQAIETNHRKTQTKAKWNLVFITLH